MDPKTARKIYPHPNRLFAPLLLSRQRLCKGESFRAFCMHTSLHGWHYMVDRSARSPVNLQRTMWGAILLLAVVTAFTFLYNNTWVGALIHKYLHSVSFIKATVKVQSRVALNFYLKVMAPGWLLYFLKYVFDMTSSYPKPSFPRVPLLS